MKNLTDFRAVTGATFSRLRRFAAPAGAYAWVLGALLTASTPARAADLDIYTKALTSGITGTPVLIFQIDNSGSMLDSMVSTSTATNILDQRLYRMSDVAMAQVTGMKSTFQLGITSYNGNNTGQRLQVARALETELPNSAGTTTYKVTDENDDIGQAMGQGVVRGGNTLGLGQGVATTYASTPVVAPYAGSWPFNYAATLELPASTGSAGNAYGPLAGLAGNAVFYYTHGGTTNVQSFLITGATANSFVAVTNVSGSTLTASATTSTGTGDCVGAPNLTNSSCVAISLTKNTTYRIVVGTNTNAQVGAFTLGLGYPARAAATNPLQIETVPPQMPRRAGLQFRRIDIPRGASITNAYLEFKSSSAQSTVGSWRVGIDPNVNALDVGNGVYGRLMNWGALTTLNAWSSGELSADTRLSVTSLLQTHVNQANWCGGDVVFAVDSKVISDGTTASAVQRDFHTMDGVWSASAAVAPNLVVQWTAPLVPPAGSACTSKTITIPIENISDDIQQNADNSIVFDSTTLTASNTRDVGLRFSLLPLPKDVTVVDARLELTPDSGSAQQLRIKLVDADNGPPYSGTPSALDALSYVQDPILGTDYVTWTPASWTAGAPVQSGNIASLIQTAFVRDNWVYDNAINLVIQGTTATSTTFRAWERNIDGASSTSIDRTKYGKFSARLILTVSSATKIPVQATHRWNLYNTMNAMPAIMSTPIMGTYIESAQYMLGTDNFAGQMPVLSSGDCATNGIVILTDGEENGSYSSSQTTPAAAISGVACSTGSTTTVWTCLYNMIKAMYEKRNTHQDGEKYSIRTDAIGFGPEAASSTGLAGVEGKGGGKFYLATDSAALTNAFRDIIANMSISTASVAASGVAVNALNRFEHLDQLYYSLFAPSTKIDWSGNLKRYRLNDSTVKDATNTDAIDMVDTGFFKTDSRSFWSGLVDGSNVSVGGAAGKTPATSRKIYTYLSSAAPNNTPLTDEIISTNSSITTNILGINNLPYFGTGVLSTVTQQNARRAAVIDFLRAAPVTDTTIRWGAAIHGSPRIVTFDPTVTPDPIGTVFYGDNRGFLHAIDAGEYSKSGATANLPPPTGSNTGGGELWAFAPVEKLANAAFFYDNTETIAANGYRWGFDGDITIYSYPKTGKPTKVWLFAGMRGGGKNYYGLDVSKSHKGVTLASDRIPKLKWIIKGGVAGDFVEMGESWSSMVTGNIKMGGTQKPILAFGGGYDKAAHDDGVFVRSPADGLDGVGFTGTNQAGRAIYLVDMDTGALVWKSTQLSAVTFPAMANMKYSITAAPLILDRDSDGNADAIYVADLAGQVFRFEINKSATSASNLISGVYMVAKLGATATGANAVTDNRRFFEAPSASRVGNDIWIAVSSGYREEMRSKSTKEGFFFFRDTNAYKTGATTNSTIQVSDLDNMTGKPASSTYDATKPGWFLYFDQTKSEKGVGSPVIINFSILFSAWNSENADVNCAPDIGKTKLYFVDFKGKGLAEGERSVDIDLPGIGDTPQILLEANNQISIGVGTRITDADDLCPGCLAGALAWKRSRWYVIDENN